MKYEKPEIVTLKSALTAVRGQTGKPSTGNWDNAPRTPMTFSVAAYEADE
jgi:hypothetical protein